MIFRSMFHEGKRAKHAVPLKRPANNPNISNNDIIGQKRHDNIKDGIEDANQNGRIDGDNGDGVWGESESWTELNPNAQDTDGDTFEDDDMKTSMYFSSPEDVIISKIQWYELGGRVSERQWLDIIGVIKVQENALEKEYLRAWAQQLGIAELLKCAYHDAGIEY